MQGCGPSLRFIYTASQPSEQRFVVTESRREREKDADCCSPAPLTNTVQYLGRRRFCIKLKAQYVDRYLCSLLFAICYFFHPLSKPSDGCQRPPLLSYEPVAGRTKQSKNTHPVTRTRTDMRLDRNNYTTPELFPLRAVEIRDVLICWLSEYLTCNLTYITSPTRNTRLHDT